MSLLEDVALFDVTIDGSPVDDAVIARVTEIRVLNYLALPDLCTFDCGFDVEAFEKQPFEIGKALEIKLGAPTGNTTSTLFKGEVVTLEPAFSAGGVRLRVRALDKAHRLQRTRKVRTFSDMTLSDIASKVISENGFSADVESSLNVHFEHFQQDNETDWDFLWRLARRVGAELFVDGDTAIMKRPESASPVELVWPSQVREFKAQVTAIQQVTEVSVASWDDKNGAALNQSATSPTQVSEIGIRRAKIADAYEGKTHIATEQLESSDEGQALAQAMLDQLANGYVSGEGVCQGNPRIRAGALLKITGVGNAFSGTYRVQSTTHTLQGGGTYQTRFHNTPVQTIRGALGSAASGVARDFGAQLTVGIVTNNQDPEDLGRVKVKYPHYNDTDEGAWARIALAGAGSDRGMTMVPQPEDEVLVAFFHGDTRYPVVLGSLHNGARKPGKELLHDVDGSWVLRSDKHIDMKALETVTIEALKDMTIKAGGEYLQEISKGATIKVGEAMALTVGRGLEVKAANDVTIKSDQGKVEITAPMSSIKLSSPQIEVSADMQLKLSGQMVQISGSQIMLG
jgi:phage protein D